MIIHSPWNEIRKIGAYNIFLLVKYFNPVPISKKLRGKSKFKFTVYNKKAMEVFKTLHKTEIQATTSNTLIIELIEFKKTL